MFKLKTILSCLLLTVLVNHAQADSQTLITEDGREILLNEDGTWEFLSNDRFVTTKDGKRIRLKAGGSWEVIGTAPVQASRQPSIRAISQAPNQKVKLDIERAIEEQVIRKIQKNVRVSSQIVFYVDIQPLYKESLSISPISASHIKVIDSLNNTYPILSITPSALSIEPNSIEQIQIRVEGAPSPFTSAKTMHVVFAPDLFKTGDEKKLNYRIADIEKKEVSRFE